jgi:peptide/nickel transport system permease protein
VRTYLLRRLVQAVPTLFLLTVIAFGFVSLAPGDVVDAMYTPVDEYGLEAMAQRREALGLNEPVPVQYLRWLGHLVQGDLGRSFIRARPVADMIGERIGATLLLGLVSIVVAAVIGVTAGLISGLRQYSAIDYIVTVLSYGAFSVPNFFLALVLIYIFSVQLKLLPSAGMFAPGRDADLGNRITHMILPVVVLSVQFIGIYARQTRSAVLEVLSADYVATARAKGLRERIVTLRHIMPNALIPVITIIGLSIPIVVTGTIITEVVFGWSGMGSLTVDAIYSRDYPVIMGIVLVVGAAVIVINLIVDICYAVVDPRIRFS